MQCQIGNHDVPGTLGVLIGLDPAISVPDLLILVPQHCLLQHFLAQVNAQHLGRSVVCGIFAVPAVAASQIQYGHALQRRKQRLELVPLSGGGQPAFAAIHLSVLGEEHVVIIFVGHHISRPFPEIELVLQVSAERF